MRQYNEVGHLFPIDVFSLAEIAEIRAHIDDLLPRALAAGWDNYQVVNWHKHCRGIWDIVTDSRIIDIVADLLGDTVVLRHSHLFAKLPGDPKRASWHQDASYLPLTPSRVVSGLAGDHLLRLSSPSIASRNWSIPDDGLSWGNSVSFPRSTGHVGLAVKILAGGAVESSAETRGCGGVEPGVPILEVQRQPEFEARIRYGDTDIALSRTGKGSVEIRVVLRPLHVEDAPDLIDLAILPRGACTSLGRRRDQGQRYRPACLLIDADVDRGNITVSRVTLQGLEIGGFRLLALTEHQERPLRSANRNVAAKRTTPALTVTRLGHQSRAPRATSSAAPMALRRSA